MRTVREILRLHFEHDLSQRAIARACSVSPTTVGDYLERVRQSGSNWATISALDDSSLKALLNPDGKAPASRLCRYSQGDEEERGNATASLGRVSRYPS